MVILVDCDDVLTNTCEVWVQACNQIYGTNFTLNDVKDWDMKTMYPDIPKSELLRPLLTEAFWTQVKPLDGAVKYLHKLIDDGHEVYICTSTDCRNIKWKIEYILKRYFSFFPIKNIIICNKKQLVKADILIDDNPSNLINGDYHGLLFYANHNLSFDVTHYQNMERVSNWTECYDAINRLME